MEMERQEGRRVHFEVLMTNLIKIINPKTLNHLLSDLLKVNNIGIQIQGTRLIIDKQIKKICNINYDLVSQIVKT
jgi:hypothetical protein